jgi:hypothetical protein
VSVSNIFTYVLYNPNGWAQSVLSFLPTIVANVLGTGSATYAATIIDGHPCLEVVTDDGTGYIRQYEFVLGSMDATNPGTPAYLFESPGFTQNLLLFSTFDGTYSLAAISGVLGDFYSLGVKIFIETFFPVTTTLLDASAARDPFVDSGTYSICVRADFGVIQSWFFLWTVSIAGFKFDAGPPPHNIQGQSSINQISSTQSAAGGGADLKRIADALDVISMQDINVSINHGAGIYSVRTMVTTGE